MIMLMSYFTERYDVDESVQNIITSPDPSSTDDKPGIYMAMAYS